MEFILSNRIRRGALDFEKVKDLKIFNQHEKRENNS
jgi:hypothetical protein